MAIVNGYATLAELKARLNITDAQDDAILEATIEAASRLIDNETRRKFYGTTEARYFTADNSGLVLIDDATAITSVVTDSAGTRTYDTTWAVTDYDTEPYNAATITRLRVTPSGAYSFPTYAKGVEVTAAWGYCALGACPDTINEACLIQAARLFKRKDAPFGVIGTPELGTARIPKVDMDVMQLLAHYVKKGLRR